MSNIPVIILKEGTEEVREKEARTQNINAMIAITDAVRSTMGPKGMDKMLVDSLGDVTITNDGAEILDKLDIENVAATMMVNLAKSIDKEVGDGTTSAVVFCAALLKNALELIEQDIHPKPIIQGYKLATDKAIVIINEIAEKISKDDEKILKAAALTSMNSKDIASAKDYFAELVLEAVKHIAEKNTGSIYDKINNIKIIKASGKSLKDSELINGIYIQKEKVSSSMPNSIKGAKIAVIRKKLDIGKSTYDSKIEISSPEDIQKFLDQEKTMLMNFLQYFKNLNVNMIVNNQDISDKFGALLSKEGIAAIKNVSESDLKAILNATNANLVDDLKGLTEEDLGSADSVKFEKIGDDDYTLFTGCEHPKSVAILLKGGLEKILNTAEIALHDVISVLAKIIDTQLVVAGGGAIYMELAKKLKVFSNEISGKEQLAIQAFAVALEEIPKTLIRNAGLDEIKKITDLRAAHKTPQDKWIGIDTIKNKIVDNFENGIVEPADLVKHIIMASSELSTLVLRVDRIINAKSAKK
ncbi:MAG: thermosome subunit [Candidatus Lokiarchaeota archaeon]|nr:thermosome subunit [Candidatus Lokiarchaeota archaeon]